MIRDKSNYLKILLSVFFVVCVILPLVQVLANINAATWNELVSLPDFGRTILNSLTAASISTAISVGLALLLSFCLARSNMRLKNAFKIVLTLPMLIPSISHGWGLRMLFGTSGILTQWLGWEVSIFGLTGIVMGSVMYSFPIAFLMLSDVLGYEDASPYEAAEVLGINKARQFTGITLPYLSKALISVIFSVFTMVVTDYGVPTTIGGTYNTLPVELLKAFNNLAERRSDLSIYSAILLMPAVAAFIIDLLKKEQNRSSFVNKAIKPRKNVVRDVLCYAVCIMMCLVVVFPIAAFAAQAVMTDYPYNLTPSLVHIEKVLLKDGDTFLINSLIVSTLVSVVGTAIAYLCAYCTARTHGVFSRALHLMSITSMAIPGLVLGLSYALFFSGTAFYGTLAILVFANTLHFFASPYLMIYNSFNIINKNLEDVGATLNISRPRILLNVLIPQTKDTLVEMMSYFFVNSMMTISAVKFLANYQTRQIALMITTFEGSGLLGCAAFVSLVILAVNLFVKTTIFVIKKMLKKKNKPVKTA